MEIDWMRLGEAAWAARERAYIIGKTRVGAALVTTTGALYSGCNVEHRYRCHDVHAEINALCSMVANGEQACIGILIVAERVRFTPCGGCMDWIFQFGGPECRVGFQGSRGGAVTVHRASELMPHYPE